jgi:hypothetical protein
MCRTCILLVSLQKLLWTCVPLKSLLALVCHPPEIFDIHAILSKICYRVFGWRAAGVKRSRSAPVGVWMRSGGSGAAGAERRERSDSRWNIPVRCGLASSLKIRGTEALCSCFSSSVSIHLPLVSLVSREGGCGVLSYGRIM